MKSVQITVMQYEVGDVLDISAVNGMHRKPSLNEGSRALVVSVICRNDGTASYKLLTNDAKAIVMKPEEMGEEKYLGAIDLSLLWGGKC